MTTGLKTIIYPVKDLTRAKALFRSLLDGDLTLLQRYPPTHLLRPTADGPPGRGGLTRSARSW